MQTPRSNGRSPHGNMVCRSAAAPQPADPRLICRILPASGALRQPWRNGGGITHQIAIWPPTAQGSDFIWRISAADVARAGSFSNWDGFERQLWITHGNGIRLTDPANGAVTVLHQGMRLDFPGECCYTCDLLEGPVRDLNVMLRRGHGTIRSGRLCGHHTVALGAGHHIIYCVRGGARVLIADSRPMALAAGDALLLQAATIERQPEVVIDSVAPATECIAVHLSCSTQLPAGAARPGG